MTIAGKPQSVDRLVDIADDGLRLVELASGHTYDEVAAATGAHLANEGAA